MPESERNDCKLCRRSNNVEDMVQCPDCDEWFHYSCAKVDESVQQDPDWKCASCASLGLGHLFRAGAGAAVSTLASTLPSPSRSEATVIDAGRTSKSTEAEVVMNCHLRWMRSEKDRLELEMEQQHQRELERKRAELQKILQKASQGVVACAQAEASGINESLVAAGIVYPVEKWIDRMVGEMKNVSFAQPSVAAKPLVGISSSSTPTATGVSRISSLDFTSPPSLPQPVDGTPCLPPPAAPLPPAANPKYPSSWTGPYYSGQQTEYNPMVSMTRGAQTQTVSACQMVPAGVPPLMYSGGAFNVNVSGTGTSVPWAATSTYPPYGISANFPTSSSGVLPSVNPVQRNYPIPGPMPIASGAGIPQAFHQFPPSFSTFGVSSAANSVPPVPNPLPGFEAGTMPMVSGAGIPSAMNQFPPNSSVFGMSSSANSAPPIPNPFPGLDALYGAPTQPPVVRTRDQLIARQVISKELPKFSGEPEDWPLFYSSFVNSTAACGYSPDENLSRLSKALEGKAKTAVKGRLTLPQNVPQILSTLYNRFGRPEIVLEALVDKVEAYPAIKANDFDGLVDLGTFVENICDHIVATGQTAQLCNPDLQKRLASKLPENLLLDWGMYRRLQGAADLRAFAAFMARVTEAALEVRISAGKSKHSKTSKSERGRDRNFLNAHSNCEPSKKDAPKETPSKETVTAVVCLACNGANH